MTSAVGRPRTRVRDRWPSRPAGTSGGRSRWLWWRSTVSRMEVGIRDLRSRTAQVLGAVRAGERVTLTVGGEPVADIVPHEPRTRWLEGSWLREQLLNRAADPQLGL